jgi:tetratricopeptide (TPR) repeat protein
MITIYWYYHRSVFPKCGSKKNIVIAVTTENSKQKNRLASDLVKNIRASLIKYRLDGIYDVILLHSHLSKDATERIKKWISFQKGNYEDIESKYNFEKMTKKLNAKFFVYGELVSRNEPNTRYCFDIGALILHTTTTLHNQASMTKEFNDIWKREISFLEQDELTGFKSNAEHICFIAVYMIGLATFTDNNFVHGIEIWEGLEKNLDTDEELKGYKENISQLKASSILLQSRMLYLEGKIEEAMTYREKYLAITPNIYDAHLVEAIKLVKLRNEPELALDHIEKAKIVAGEDGTWKYNKLYILIVLKKHSEALGVLDDIIETKYDTEIDTVIQVISYNQACLDENPDHVQSLFIIGALLYTKLNNPPFAYEKLSNFIDISTDMDEWKVLHQRAKIYLTEISELIGIKTS